MIHDELLMVRGFTVDFFYVT